MAAERLNPEDLEWLLDQVGIKRESRMRRVLVRRHVDGYTDAAIAAELGITPKSVREVACRAWARLERVSEERERSAYIAQLVAFLQAREDAGTPPETLRQHAAALLGAMRGKRKKTGKSGGPDPTKAGPVIDLADVMEICARPPQRGEQPVPLGSVDAQRRGPYQGQTTSRRGRPLTEQV